MKPSPHRFLTSLLLLFSISSPPAVLAQEVNLRSIVQQLKKIDTESEGYPSPDVPPLARGLLVQLKPGLREAILRSLNSHNVFDPQILRDLIVSDLKNEGIELPDGSTSEPESGGPFGGLEDLRVAQPTRHTDLLAVVTQIGIPCGSDSSLYLFQRAGIHWQLLMVQESGTYEDVSGAQGSFEFAVSPPDEEGNWFVVTANVNPWCTSNWQSLRYQVLRPQEPGKAPLELLNKETTIYLGADKPYSLKIHQQGFTITNAGSQSLDAAILVRTQIHKYRVKASSAERIAPIALAPEDFLDEWVNLNWDQAAQWVRSSDSSQLEYWHGRLSRADDSKQRFFTEFDFVQPCPSIGTRQRWQLGLSLEGSGEEPLPEDVPDELFFSIVKQEGAFYLESVATERTPGCPGETPPQGPQVEVH